MAANNLRPGDEVTWWEMRWRIREEHTGTIVKVRRVTALVAMNVPGDDGDHLCDVRLDHIIETKHLPF